MKNTAYQPIKTKVKLLYFYIFEHLNLIRSKSIFIRRDIDFFTVVLGKVESENSVVIRVLFLKCSRKCSTNFVLRPVFRKKEITIKEI